LPLLFLFLARVVGDGTLVRGGHDGLEAIVPGGLSRARRAGEVCLVSMVLVSRPLLPPVDQIDAVELPASFSSTVVCCS
jgi:hypothetical protein